MSSNKEGGAAGKTLGEELASAVETGAEDGGGKKRKKKGRGGSKKKLLLIPVVVALAALAGGFAWKRFSSGGPVKADRGLLLRKAHSIGENSGGEEEGAVLLKAPNPHATEEETAVELSSMTMSESIDYIEALVPRSLGLEGNSMDEYEVFPTVGTVLVDGLPCTEVYIYRQDVKTGTNTFQGSYLLDRSGNALYELDRDQGIVTQLQPLRGDDG